ncbi:hypothetical protein KXV68_007927 [Aspergillus fumigatus]|nr:hypothetical protein KXX11_009966 [Aspergillus fumigatus]KAH1336981.1 hypothetical protein KXX67_002261 [Aspergillus fumigatus]KAH1535607.1 hypothetical protein KXX18_008229 [Aspergillus fumigatus]KAH1579347.1 hypothetical protein KXX17_005049 [Aspergillus fumigatus]KAH1602479.1 hypothetical protein KXX44_003666 [Aspergillus fumigatus]
MPDKLSLLVQEVERLITAPYAPSLQSLYDIIQNDSNGLVNAWATRKPCQVGALVDVLLDGLSRSRFALPLLNAFASVSAFSDALLERHPAVLDQFLEKALKSDESEWMTLCTAILSTPLPPKFIAPARLAPFIMRLINALGENPCSETIFPLYQIMTGLQPVPGVLLEISPETMSSLQVEITKTLRNLDDHMGNLLCLATFARISLSWDTNAEREHGPQSPTWLQNVKHFFGQKRGLKTLDLVILRVILACSASCDNLPPRKAAESIRLAIEICDSVEQGQKDCWIANNAPKIAKLCEKVNNNGIDWQVQMMGLTFLTSLLPDSALSPEIPRSALQGLLTQERQSSKAVPQYLIPRLVKANAILSGKLAICDLMNHIFTVLKTHCDKHNADTELIELSRSVLLGLQSVEPRILSSALATNDLREINRTLNELTETVFEKPSPSQCEGANLCYASTSNSANELLFDLIVFTSLMSPLGEMGSEVSNPTRTSSLTNFLLKAKSSIPKNNCSFSEFKPWDSRVELPLVVLPKRGPTSRHDWRTGIAETLTLSLRMTHNNLIQKMEEVCFDLEQRCTTIEAPLRAVEDERDQIAVQAEQLKQQKSELELQLQQASSTISELQQEIFHLENHARSTSARVEELSTSLDTARRELEDQRRTSQETTNSEREKARTRELDLLASITEKDDQIEELQEETRNLREDNNALRQILDTVSKEKNTSLEHTAALKQDVVRLEQCVEHGKLLLAQRDEEMSRLQADQGHMKSQMEALQKKLDEESAQVQELKTALRNAEETHRTEVNTLKKQYESQISEITVEYTENKGEMKALQAVMHAAASSATKELQAKERRIQHLERKVQQLRDERALKAREFSEAQQHIGRLMSVMGFKPGPREPKAASKQQCSGSTLGPLEAVTIQQQTAQRDEDPQSQSQNMLGDSFASPTPQSGRSPKRFRTTAADQDLGESRTQSQARPRRNRQALGEANRNKQTNSQRSGASQCTPNASLQGAQAGPNWDENHFHDIDLDMDLEFSKDFVFTSTALSEANDHIPSLRSQQ